MKHALHIDQAVERVVRRLEQDYAAIQRHDMHGFRVVLNEARALAWDLPWPHLVLPVLAEEKLKGMADWRFKQKQVRKASARILEIVA